MSRAARLPFVALGLVLLLAAFLRLWRLDALPPGLYHDEAYNGLDALSLVQGRTFPQFYEGWELYAQEAHGEQPPQPTRFPLFFEGNYGREPFHIYFMALAIWLLGPTPVAVRLVPALFGVVGVWATYLAAGELLYGDKRAEERTAQARWLPVLAAFFLTILLPAIHFSRFGLRAMLFVPVEMLTVFFFWRGYHLSQRILVVRYQVLAAYCLAGFFLGLGIYIYAAARLFPLLFVLFILFWAWQDWSGLRQNLLNIVGMAGLALLTALPLLLFFWRYPYFFVFRIAYVANKGRGTVADQPLLTWLLNVGRTIRGLYWQGETHLRHNLPGRPYLDPIQAVFFTLGILHTLRQKLNPRTVFLLLWLIVMLLPTIMSGDAPHFGRMTGAAGVIAILLAVGFVWLVSLSGKWMTDYRLLITAFALLLLGSLTFTIRDYFGRYANHPQLAADFYLPDWQLGQFAAEQPTDTVLYLSPTQEELATIYFALADPTRLRNYSGDGGVVPAGIPGQPVLYLLRPEETAVLHTLQATFPEGNLVETPNDSFMAYALPTTAERQRLPEEIAVSFAGNIQLVGWSAEVSESQLMVQLAWRAKQIMVIDYTAFVHLVDEDGRILSQLDRPPAGYPTSDWQPGEIVLDSFVLSWPTDLPAGRLVLETGFYDLATLNRLGEPAVLSQDLARVLLEAE